MPRIASRRTFLALAALALVTAFAIGPASAQGVPSSWENLTLNGEGAPQATVKKPKTPRGLTAQKPAQPNGVHNNKIMMYLNASQSE
ncbi:MAG: hypothetical protein WED13_02505 [Methyloceanibacter sp.]